MSTEKKLNRYSARITAPRTQGASQAMLYGTGLTEADMARAQVGIASIWYEGNTCNMHLLDLAAEARRGVRDAGLIGFRFNAIGVSDGISMGTEGMSYSLQSRDLIADSLETMMRAQWYDALIALPGCDKNMPGVLMAMARVNRPAIMIYGGTIRAGIVDGCKVDIISAFQSYGEYLSGHITDEQRARIVRGACPGAGACGGMYTANTMAAAIEAMGMSLPYSASTPAEDPGKKDECRSTGLIIHKLLELDLKPRDIMSPESFENAMVMVTVLGGSTNAVLHLIAMAKAAGVKMTLRDVQRISARTPLLCDLKPSGRYVMVDLHNIGGTPAVMKHLLRHGLLHGECITVTGKTLAENLADIPSLAPDQDVVRPFDDPIKADGHIRILYGNLAPGGAVAKITGKEGERFVGPALVFDSEEDMLKALKGGHIKGGEVIVIRYEGPKGGPGMPEMLTPTSAVIGAGLGNKVAFITDGRFSGGSHGFIIGHVVPEAQEGGPIALIRDNDRICIDARENRIDVELSDAELEQRRRSWKNPPYKVTSGTLYKYIKTVKNASEGCVTDE